MARDARYLRRPRRRPPLPRRGLARARRGVARRHARDARTLSACGGVIVLLTALRQRVRPVQAGEAGEITVSRAEFGAVLAAGWRRRGSPVQPTLDLLEQFANIL